MKMITKKLNNNLGKELSYIILIQLQIIEISNFFNLINFYKLGLIKSIMGKTINKNNVRITKLKFLSFWS